MTKTGKLSNACALTGHALPVMVFLMAVALAERSAFRPDQRLLSGSLLAASVVVYLS